VKARQGWRAVTYSTTSERTVLEARAEKEQSGTFGSIPELLDHSGTSGSLWNFWILLEPLEGSGAFWKLWSILEHSGTFWNKSFGADLGKQEGLRNDRAWKCV
jgi:hypothetical protein